MRATGYRAGTWHATRMYELSALFSSTGGGFVQGLREEFDAWAMGGFAERCIDAPEFCPSGSCEGSHESKPGGKGWPGMFRRGVES